jgi:hypothetical protein
MQDGPVAIDLLEAIASAYINQTAFARFLTGIKRIVPPWSSEQPFRRPMVIYSPRSKHVLLAFAKLLLASAASEARVKT